MRSYMPVFLLLLLVGCPKQGPGPTPTPVVHDTDWCTAAGQNIAVACPELAETPNGKPFDVFCRETHGNDVFLNPRCVASARDCGDVDKCLQDPQCALGGDACLK